MDLWRWHPDRVLRRLLRALPYSIQGWASTLFVVFAWYGLINSTLSILSDLRWFADLIVWLIERSGALKSVLLQIGKGIHTLVVAWRGLTAPLLEMLFGWMPFKAPGWALDIAVIAMVYCSAAIRSLIVVVANRGPIYAAHRRAIEERKAEVQRLKDAGSKSERYIILNQQRRSMLVEQLAASELRVSQQQTVLDELERIRGTPGSRGMRRHLQQILDTEGWPDTLRMEGMRLNKEIEDLDRSTAVLGRDGRNYSMRATDIERELGDTEQLGPSGWPSLLRSARLMRVRAFWISGVLLSFLLLDALYSSVVLPSVDVAKSQQCHSCIGSYY